LRAIVIADVHVAVLHVCQEVRGMWSIHSSDKDLFIPSFPSTLTLKAAGDEQEREGLVKI